MSILAKLGAARKLIALYREKPFTQVGALLDAEKGLAELEQELQAFAEDLRRDCCNSSCHLDDTLKKLKGDSHE